VTEAAVFRDLTLLLVAAVLGGALAQFLRQPAFVGYILGGLAVTAVAGPAIPPGPTFELFAQLGVVLLMFSLGVDLSLRELWRVGGLALFGTPLGMVVLAGLTAMLIAAFGIPWPAAILTGLALAVSSTMALAKLLADRGDLAGPVGRANIGISLAQDLVVVAAIFFLPALAAGQDAPPGDFLYALLRGALVLVPFFLLANRLVPAILGRIAHTRNTELFVLVAVAIGTGMAALSAGLGLTLALGAFLAGLVISESDYATETLARVLPLRDLFVAVFFVSMGMLIDVRALAAQPGVLLVMLGVVLVAKPVVWTAIALAFRQPLPVAVAVGLGQAQIGEFSFVVAQVGYATGLFGLDLYSAVLATSLVTLVVNALVFRRSRPLERWTDRRARPADAVPTTQPPRVVIVGYGRVGSAVGEALETFGVPFAVVDFNPAVVQDLRRRVIPAVLGDAANDHALRAAGAAAARLVILAVPDSVKAGLALARLLQINPSLSVLARGHTADDRERLLTAGATEVILPEVEAGMTLVDHALHRVDVPPTDVRVYLRQLREAERPGGRAVEVSVPAGFPRLAVVEISEGPLAHQSLRRARVRERTGVTVCGVERHGEDPYWNPPPDAVLAPGDRVTIFGLPQQIERFRMLAAGGED
jgi:CPA2 family monovalent cation:H+ antiporter-2